MINLLHGIGNEVAAPKKNGKKMKKGKLIPVQTTAKGRRDKGRNPKKLSTKIVKTSLSEEGGVAGIP